MNIQKKDKIFKRNIIYKFNTCYNKKNYGNKLNIKNKAIINLKNTLLHSTFNLIVRLPNTSTFQQKLKCYTRSVYEYQKCSL